MGDYGIKVTKPGKDVASEDVRDYITWSKYPILKTESSGSGTVTAASSDNITHNLGYNPLALIYVELPAGSGKYTLVYELFTQADLSVRNVSSDLNNITIQNLVASDRDYFYYLFYDETLA